MNTFSNEETWNMQPEAIYPSAPTLYELDHVDDDISGKNKQQSYPRISYPTQYLDTMESTKDFLLQLQRYTASKRFIHILHSSRKSQDESESNDEHFDPDVVFVASINDSLEQETGIPRAHLSNSNYLKLWEKAARDECEKQDFVWIDDDDVIQAMGDYFAATLARSPKQVIRLLSPEDMQRIVARSLQELQEQGSLRLLWNWGKNVYSCYEWGSKVVALYRQPAIMYIVMRILFLVIRWMLL
jgi:hypothetical protein